MVLAVRYAGALLMQRHALSEIPLSHPVNTAEGVLLPYTMYASQLFRTTNLLTTLSFEANVMSSYRVEFSNDLLSRLWQALPGGPHNTGIARDSGMQTTRFYRAVEIKTGALVPLQITGTPEREFVSYYYWVSFDAWPGWNYKAQALFDSSAIWQDFPVTGGSFSLYADSPSPEFRIVATPPIRREDYEAILMAGQSNALLYQNPSIEQTVPNALYFASGAGFKELPLRDPAAPPLYGYNFGTAALLELAESAPRKRMLIPVAVGATSIETWLPKQDPFDRNTLFGRADSAVVMAAPQGLTAIWYYGHEASMLAAGGIESYASQWGQLVGSFRQAMGAVPFIYAQVAKSTDDYTQRMLHAGAEIQRQLEAVIPQHFMVVTFDLPLADGVHLSADGQQMLGHRFAMAMREHIYKQNVNGTGPRLQKVAFTQPARTEIAVQFNRPINICTNNYDGQFTIMDQGEQRPVASIERGSDESLILLRVPDPVSPEAMVEYGNVIAPGLFTFRANVVRDQDGLPAPQFGPLPVLPPG